MNPLPRLLFSVTLLLALPFGAFAQSGATGRIGVGTWKTEAEFRHVRVTRAGKVLYAADFAPGSPGWPYTRGEWEVKDNAYRQTDPGEDRRAYVGDPRWGDYTLTLQARKLDGQEGFLIFFRVRDLDHYSIWSLGGDDNTHDVLAQHSGSADGRLGPVLPGGIATGRWYDIRVSVQGAHIRCWLDDQLMHDVFVSPAPKS